jgi:putative oxidoreductase
MTNTPSIGSAAQPASGQAGLERAAARFARFALSAAFLSAVASRVGLWTGKPVAAAFADFVKYTGEVNAFLPASLIPASAYAATVMETLLGVLLVLGVWPRATALASAVLLIAFGAAMATSLGLQSPLDYSVFSAAGAALLLASRPDTRNVGRP